MAKESDGLRDRLQDGLGDSYTLERELGGGGMSRVFLAEERALGRHVVVKVLSPEIAHGLSAERFAREIRLSARFQHPHILPVLVVGEALGVPYYTMPFVEGESLRARLNRLTPGEVLPYDESVTVLRDVARALDYAHAVGVVHRDIKPDNVLLSHGAAVIADFGVAKAIFAARTLAPGASTTLTQGGVALGTPAYMAPEQASGDPEVDHRADIYAWGVLAFELLSGRHPFADRGSVQQLITAHLVDAPPELLELAPGVPGALATCVMRCLAKDPADRPQSAAEVVDVLSHAMTDRTAATSDAASPARTRTGPRRAGRPRLWAGALVTLALSVIIVAQARSWLGDKSTTLRGAPDTGATPVAPANGPAYDEYLRGKVRVSSENRQDNDAAINALQRAIALDPRFAPAYAELARAYHLKAFYFASDSARKQLIEDAEIAVEKALALDPRLGEAHFARGLILWSPQRRFPHEQAVRAYRRALELNPRLDEAHHQLALVYLHVGLLDKARVELDEALAINPGNALARFRIGVNDLYRGRFDDAYAIFSSTPLERNPTMWAFQMATVQFRLGRSAEAMALIDRFLRESPRDEGGVGHSVRAMILAASGRRADARAAIARSIALGRGFGHFHHAAYNIASAYALMGDRTEAIQWLRDAAEDGFPCYPLFSTDTQLDELRADPRFVELLAGMKRSWEERVRSF